MKIRAVLFDLANTLAESKVPETRIFQRILKSLGISKSIDEIGAALAETKELYETSRWASLHGATPYEEFWGKWDSTVMKHLGIPDFERFGVGVQRRWDDHIRFDAYPEASRTIMKLKQMRLKIGLVSTGYEKEIKAILTSAKLDRAAFDVIVGADTTKKKPHPDAFGHALRSLDVQPEGTLFVGDDINNDYNGAKAAGLHAVLIKREDNGPRESGLRTIRSLDEILGLLE